MENHHVQKLLKVSFWFVVILSLFFLALTVNELKENRFIGGGVPISNTITVAGEGEVFAVPDIAEFSFSVAEERDDVAAAQKASAEKINSITDFLKESGIDEKDIRTTGYNLYPRYEYRELVVNCLRAPCPPQSTRVLVGYEVRQTILIKVRKTDEAGEILGGVGKLGATDVSGLTFTVDDEDGLIAEARALAIDDARNKAKELAKDLGVDLVRVVSFSEGGRDIPFYASKFDVAAESAFDEGFMAPDIPVGENQIISSVFITYEIR